MKRRISPRVGRTLVWVVAVLVAGFLFNAQQNQQDRADQDRVEIERAVDRTAELARDTEAANKVVTDALCTYRQDLVTRRDGAKRLLKQHPHGLPGLATAQDLKASILAQKHAIDALSTLTCPASPQQP
jgi:hypothetical protein